MPPPSGGIVKHRIDADGLLEDGEQNADDDDCHAVSEQLFSLFLGRLFDFFQYLSGHIAAIDFLQNGKRTVVFTAHH